MFPGYPKTHFHPEFGTETYQDTIHQTQDFDVIAHFYGKADQTAVWNKYRLSPATVERLTTNQIQ